MGEGGVLDVFNILATLIVCSGMLCILLLLLFRAAAEVKGVSLWTWKPSPDWVDNWCPQVFVWEYQIKPHSHRHPAC